MGSNYRHLVGEMRDAYFVIQDAKIQMLSSSELAKLGYDENELIGRPFTCIFPPEVHEELLKNYERMLSGHKKRDRFRTELIAADGIRTPVEVSVWTTWHLGKPSVAGIILDLSGRQETEQALLESEEKLRVMLESISEGIAVIDMESHIIDMNPVMLVLYGYDSKEEVIGRSAFEFIPVEYWDIVKENMKKTLEEGSIGNLEIMLMNKNGERYEAEISAAPLRDKSGESMGHIAITRDVTERKRREAENIQLQETLNLYSNQVIKASRELVHAIRGVNALESRPHPIASRSLARYSTTGADEVELLTPREIQVLQLAARGMSNKDIGAELEITVRTVKGHLMNIYAKMKVKSRTEAVSSALKEGWITLEDMGYGSG